mgnify:CR=1 FL=1
MKRCYRRRVLKETAEEKAKMKAWEKDLQLDEHTSLYHEYLEMGKGREGMLDEKRYLQ